MPDPTPNAAAIAELKKLRKWCVVACRNVCAERALGVVSMHDDLAGSEAAYRDVIRTIDRRIARLTPKRAKKGKPCA